MKEKIRQVLSQRKKKTITDEGLIPAAVLIPIYEKAGEYYLVFTKRTEVVDYHKGQISFPGGARQAGDETLKDAALRESWEEIGLDPQDVEILGELDDEPTYITAFIISPFVAAIPYPYQFRASPKEVEEIIEVPIAALLDKSSLRQEIRLGPERVLMPFYDYNGKVIWGATARILKHFLELVFGH